MPKQFSAPHCPCDCAPLPPSPVTALVNGVGGMMAAAEFFSSNILARCRSILMINSSGDIDIPSCCVGIVLNREELEEVELPTKPGKLIVGEPPEGEPPPKSADPGERARPNRPPPPIAGINPPPPTAGAGIATGGGAKLNVGMAGAAPAPLAVPATSGNSCTVP